MWLKVILFITVIGLSACTHISPTDTGNVAPTAVNISPAEQAHQAYKDRQIMVLEGDGDISAEWERILRARWRRTSTIEDPFIRELGQRAVIDQYLRYSNIWNVEAVSGTLGVDLSPEEKSAFSKLMQAYWLSVDTENINWLRAEYETHGHWFKVSEIGEDAASDAWLIVQHAIDDKELMRSVLADMERYVQEGEASGKDYALLYDRVQMQAGLPQRYGSQFVCNDGVYSAYQIEEPDKVNELRANVGLNTFEANALRFSDMTCN